jgi:hypothetical protein
LALLTSTLQKNMKNIRAVYQKLREVKHHHYVALLKIYSKKIPSNCKYNYLYTVSTDKNKNEVKIGLCLLHQPDLNFKEIHPHIVDVCQYPHHCANCNGFVINFSKEMVKELFEEELKDIKLKEKKYPDICALEWVLEQSVVGLPPFSTIQKMYYAIKKWLSKNRVL